MHEHLRSRRLEPIVRVADRKEQAAVQEFGKAQDAMSAEERKLAELRAWWREYADALGAKPCGRTAVLRDARLFLGQLSEAVNRQQVLVEHARGRLEAARAQWLAMRMDREALEKVVTRFRAEEERAAQRDEQREQDECASRRIAGVHS